MVGIPGKSATGQIERGKLLYLLLELLPFRLNPAGQSGLDLFAQRQKLGHAHLVESVTRLSRHLVAS